MPPFAPPKLFGQGSYDPSGQYWRQWAGEQFRDFNARTAMPAMRIANGAPMLPRLTAATNAPSASAAPPFVGPVRPGSQSAGLISPMRAANDAGFQDLMAVNPQAANLAATNGPAFNQAVADAQGGVYLPMLLAGAPAAAPQTGAAGGGGGNAPTWDIPYGVDPTWYKQFAAEHSGKPPEEVYKRDGEYAIAHALSDKAWGDQFYRTYGRPPSEYDWKASYYQRQNTFYGG